VIERDHPHLVIEFTDQYLRAFGHSAEALANWLFDRQYAIYRITENGLVRLAQGRVPADTQFNALCVHEDRLPPPVARNVRG
jgi:hypothetical protein